MLRSLLTVQPGIEPGPPQRETSTLEKSHSNGLFNCYSEPLKYCPEHSPMVARSSEHLHMSAQPVENVHDMAPPSAYCYMNKHTVNEHT
jgi:hypothetical protein